MVWGFQGCSWSSLGTSSWITQILRTCTHGMPRCRGDLRLRWPGFRDDVAGVSSDFSSVFRFPPPREENRPPCLSLQHYSSTNILWNKGVLLLFSKYFILWGGRPVCWRVGSTPTHDFFYLSLITLKSIGLIPYPKLKGKGISWFNFLANPLSIFFWIRWTKCKSSVIALCEVLLLIHPTYPPPPASFQSVRMSGDTVCLCWVRDRRSGNPSIGPGFL